jgi:lysophospholipase L1-like esterase
MRRMLALLAAFALVLGTVGQVAAAGGSSADKANSYYLSLGDSIAAGVQPIGDPDDMYRTDQGYAEQLFQMTREQYSKLSLEKLGCPGETTATMIDGGICDYSHGSQLDEAVAFLHAHRQFVAFVTITIGANDFNCDTGYCLEQGVQTIEANLPTILAALRDAAGPGIPIVGMTIFNPFLGYWLLGPDGQAFAHASATQLTAVNAVLREIYEAAGAGVADIEAAFSSNDFTTMVALPGAGTVPLNVARICMWTWVCAPAPYGPNNHPNAEGYGVIAGAYAVELAP